MILLFLLISSICFAQEESTGTVKIELVPPTTAQILASPTTAQILIKNYIEPVLMDKGKIIAIDLLLLDRDYYRSLCGVNIDKETGQILMNYKYMLKEEERNQELGRNYVAGVTFPIFRLEK